MNGYSFTVLSAVFLGLTVISDKVLFHTLYRDNARFPFFISTTLGSIIWLAVIPVIWFIGGDVSATLLETLTLVHREIYIAGFHVPVALFAFIAGIATNQTLRHYFRCFEDNAPVIIAMVIAVTPMFVFTAELFFNHTSWQAVHFVSVLIATLGLIGYESTIVRTRGVRIRVRAFHLIAFVGYSVGYLILMDQILATMTMDWGMENQRATLLILPYYFLGFGTGALTIVRRDVREFVQSLRRKKDIFLLLIFLEVIGEGFYFFEMFGLAELSATLVALIVGAHVVLVWFFELYLEKVRRNVPGPMGVVLQLRILSFTFGVPRNAISENGNVYAQALCITLSLLGIALWPG